MQLALAGMCINNFIVIVVTIIVITVIVITCWPCPLQPYAGTQAATLWYERRLSLQSSKQVSSVWQVSQRVCPLYQVISPALKTSK